MVLIIFISSSYTVYFSASKNKSDKAIKEFHSPSEDVEDDPPEAGKTFVAESTGYGVKGGLGVSSSDTVNCPASKDKSDEALHDFRRPSVTATRKSVKEKRRRTVLVIVTE